jgi:hypothetical protein
MNEEKPESFVIIKSWHTVIIVLTLIVTGTVGFANLRDQGDENTRRIEDLERRPTISPQLYDANQEATREHLNRIEHKLDLQDVRNFKIDSDPDSYRKKR